MFGRNKAEEEIKESRQERKEREKIEKEEAERFREEEIERQQIAREVERREKEEADQAKKERLDKLQSKISEYKLMWDKNGVIQFKNERMAILQRRWGMQVEFIVAFDDLAREGYELKAVDEGKTAGESYTGGQNSFYYFQKRVNLQ